VVPVLLLDQPLDLIVRLFHGILPHGLAEALFTAALPEELLKFAVVVLFCARHKEFDEPMDGIVYGAVASLGFATFENIAYVAEHGFGVAVSRALTAVPGHAFMGAVMGYFVGQWRFGDAAARRFALAKAYFIPVGLHWMYDFPLLALRSADEIKGPAHQTAMDEAVPFILLSVTVLTLEAIWAVRLVNRMRHDQIEMTRAVAAAAAAAAGASDVIAIINAHPADKPPSPGLGWLMAVIGGLVATFGGFVSLVAVVFFFDPHSTGGDAAAGSLAGGIPLLIGLVLFVFGVKRIHAARHVAQEPLPVVAAAAAGA
jgi:protease PrsW